MLGFASSLGHSVSTLDIPSQKVGLNSHRAATITYDIMLYVMSHVASEEATGTAGLIPLIAFVARVAARGQTRLCALPFEGSGIRAKDHQGHVTLSLSNTHTHTQALFLSRSLSRSLSSSLFFLEDIRQQPRE
jgi:hypothetical protein